MPLFQTISTFFVHSPAAGFSINVGANSSSGIVINTDATATATPPAENTTNTSTANVATVSTEKARCSFESSEAAEEKGTLEAEEKCGMGKFTVLTEKEPDGCWKFKYDCVKPQRSDARCQYSTRNAAEAGERAQREACESGFESSISQSDDGCWQINSRCEAQELAAQQKQQEQQKQEQREQQREQEQQQLQKQQQQQQQQQEQQQPQQSDSAPNTSVSASPQSTSTPNSTPNTTPDSSTSSSSSSSSSPPPPPPPPQEPECNFKTFAEARSAADIEGAELCGQHRFKVEVSRGTDGCLQYQVNCRKKAYCEFPRFSDAMKHASKQGEETCGPLNKRSSINITKRADGCYELDVKCV